MESETPPAQVGENPTQNMSTSYTAHALIGQRVPEALITTPKHNDGCEHQLAPDDHFHARATDIPRSAKHCPHCGKPVRIVESKSLFDYWDEPPDGLTFVQQDKYESDERVGYVFVGAIFSSDGCDDSGVGGKAKLDNGVELGIAKDRVREFLQPLGLWDEAEFGLWAVFQIS
jgi:hypothetical protein